MIRIDLDTKIKEEIETLYLEDAANNNTGIFQILQTYGVQSLLKQNHQKIYEKLYDLESGELHKEEVTKLLLADRMQMKEYIAEFGAYDDKMSLSEELLDQIFRYDTYSKRKIAIVILRKMNITVCPYCNRQYVFTVQSGKVRAQLDHYYPKSRYPYLALSLYNMIPCCSICNRTKSSLDTYASPILYPYDEEYGYTAKFTLRLQEESNYVQVMQGLSDAFEIQLDTTESQQQQSIKNQMNKLHLDELYNNHTDYVRDIIRSKYVNTPERVNELYKSFPLLFHSTDEVKSLLYMTQLHKEFWGKHPLSKLTHDIDQQLEGECIYFDK